MYCMKCGSKLEEGSKFCGSCGTPVPGLQQEVLPNLQTVTTVEKKKSSSKNLMICFFSLLFIAIVGVAAFFILFKDNTKETQSVENEISNDSDEKDAAGGKDATTVDPSRSGNGKSTEPDSSVDISAEETEEEDNTDTTNTAVPTETPTPEPTETPVPKQVRHDYSVFQEDFTWTEAAEYCESLGGHLVTITSLEEQEKVEDIIDSNTMKVVMLGSNDFTDDGSYQWTNGEEFIYSRWLTGEPNNENNVEHYLYLYYVDEVWQWNDAPNDVIEYYSGKIAFVCEWEIEEN